MTTSKINRSGEAINFMEKKCPKNEGSARSSSKRDSTRQQSTSCILISRKGEMVSASAGPIDDENEGSNKECSDCIPSEQHISANSDISSGVERPLVGDNIVLHARIAQQKNLISGVNGTSSITHDTQQRTESSCSNSCITYPVYSSSDNFQETSIEAKSSMQHNVTSSASAPTSFISNMEDPVAHNLASGIAAQIAQKVVDNVNDSENMKSLSGIHGRNSSTENSQNLSSCTSQMQRNLDALSQDMETGFQERDHALRPPRCAARKMRQNLDSHTDKVHGGVNCSGNHSVNNGSVETNKESHSCIQSESYGHFCSKGGALHFQSSTTENGSPFTSLQESAGMDPAKKLKFSGSGCEMKAPACPVTKFEIQEQTALVSLFDLNEDIHQNEFDDHIPSFKVIRVVAKSGVPIPFPMTMSSLKFEGQLGWRGRAATSAFRPPSFSKSSDRNTFSTDTREINLNVAATADCPEIELPCEYGLTSGTSTFKASSSNDSSRQVKMFNFDLNLLGDNAIECPRSSFPVKLEKNSSVCEKLHEDPCIGEAMVDANSHIQKELIMKKEIELEAYPVISRDQDLKFVRLGNGRELNSMQILGNGLGQPYLVATPNMQQPVEHMQRMLLLQSKLPYVVPMLPSHSYPLNGPFYIGPASSLSSSNNYAGVVPCTRNAHERSIFPQVLNSGAVPVFPGTPYPYLIDAAHGHSPSAFMRTQTRCDVNRGEVHLMNNLRRNDNVTQMFFPTQSTQEQMKFYEQSPLCATSLKRREPEGGCDSFQPGYRHT